MGGGPAPDAGTGPSSLLVLCTGNAARSVMAGYMLEHLADAHEVPLTIVTAGTHTISGQPMSIRTRAAVASIPALADAPVSAHRSRQLRQADLDRAELVVAMEADHVRYVRRRHPEAADRTAVIRLLVERLDERTDARPDGSQGTLSERIARLELAAVDLDDGDDVIDPAGKDEAAYIACAAELWQLCGQLVARL